MSTTRDASRWRFEIAWRIKDVETFTGEPRNLEPVSYYCRRPVSCESRLTLTTPGVCRYGQRSQ